MFKWVLGLCISLYAVLILFGGDGYDPEKYAKPEPAVETEEVQIAETVVEETVPVETASTNSDATTSTDANEIVTPVVTASLDENITAASEAVATSSEVRPTLVLQTTSGSTNLSEEATSAPTEISPVGQIWTVTGSRVNLRSGASTTNGVIGRALRGESAEIVEMLDNGWAKVFILESGIEAYMSSDFIAPDQG